MKAFALLLVTCLALFQVESQKYTRYDVSVEIVKQQKDKITVVMVTSSNKNCHRCNMAKEMFEKVQKNHPYITTMVVDCERMKQEEESEYERLKAACEDFKILPHITVFEMQSEDKTRKWPYDHIYTGMVSEEHIVNYADKLMLNYVEVLESRRELKMFLESRRNNYKVIYFGDRDEDSQQIPPFLKTLSVKFRGDISFAFIDFEHKSLRKLYPAIQQKERTLVFLSPQDRDSFEEGRFNYFEFQDGEVEPFNYKKLEDFVQYKFQQAQDLAQNPGQAHLEVRSQEIDTQKLQKLMKSQNGWILLELKSQNSQNSFTHLSQIKQDFRNLFHFYELNVKSGDEQTKEFIWSNMGLVEKLPQTIIYPLGRKNLNYFMRLGQSGDVLKSQDLAQQLLQYVTPSETTLQEYANDKAALVKDWATRYYEQKKVPIVWFFNQNDPIQQLYIQTISNLNKYRKDFVFGKISDPSPEHQKHWQIQAIFPQVLAITEIKGEHFSRSISVSKERDFKVFERFFDGLQKRQNQEKVKSQKIEDVNDPDVFDRVCRDNKPCMIAIRENYKESKSKAEAEALEQLKNYY